MPNDHDFNDDINNVLYHDYLATSTCDYYDYVAKYNCATVYDGDDGSWPYDSPFGRVDHDDYSCLVHPHDNCDCAVPGGSAVLGLRHDGQPVVRPYNDDDPRAAEYAANATTWERWSRTP